MGHDIYGFNKAGEEIAYARFSMGDYYAHILYNLLDADKYNGGVSGIGDSSTYTKEQMEKALGDFKQFYNKKVSRTENELLNWKESQIRDFILNCLETAQKEGHVKVLFG